MRIASGVTDQYIYFVAVNPSDFTTRVTGLTGITVYRSRNGAAAAAMTTPTINEVDSSNMPGVYELLLDEDMTIGSGNETEAMAFHITHSGMAPVTIQIELYRPKITAGNTLGVAADGDISGNVDGSVASVTGAVGSVTGSVGSVTGAVGSVTGNVGGNVTGSIGSLGAQAKLDVNAEADTALADYDPPTRAELTSDIAGLNDPTAAAIADAVLDEALSGHTTAGTLGKAVADIETDATAILADTNELQTDDIPGAIAGLNDPTAAAIADAVWDELQSGHVTVGSFGEVATEVAAILVDTAEIGSAGAGLTEAGGTGDHLTAVPWNTAWDAEVESEVTDALNAYDPPTNAELTAGLGGLNDPTAAAIADAVWDELQSGHVTVGSFGEIATEIASILADTNELQTDDVPGLIAALENLSAAQVNAEVVDVLSTDTFAEPTGVPAATASLAVKLGTLYMALRNQIDVTATKMTFYDDGGAAEWEKDLSDDGTTYSESEANAI